MQSNLQKFLDEERLTVEEFAKNSGLSVSVVGQMCKSRYVPLLSEAYIVSRVINRPVEEIWPCTLEVEERTVTIRSIIKDQPSCVAYEEVVDEPA